MPISQSHRDLSRAQFLAERAFDALQRFMHVEAVSGVVLLAAATVALAWANSPWAEGYHALWHLPIGISFGEYSLSRSLHFWVNDALMTIFFLVVGMEVRREIHEGALSRLDQAALPLAAAAGGVIVPGLIYLALNMDGIRSQGWAVPTATDIAFAVGVLALLGKSIPGNVRVFLLALAIIDDVVAILIIAAFYSGGLNPTGFVIATLGILMIVGLQRIGIGSAFAYVFPGTVVWAGLLMTGAHPTLAGVILGLMTPVVTMATRDAPIDVVCMVADRLRGSGALVGQDSHELAGSLRQLRFAQREIMPPVTRIQTALHPWVAFGIMPIFALANAGVTVGGVDLEVDGVLLVMLGVAVALVVGKPLGVLAASWLTVRLGLCRLPPGVTWNGVFLVGLLAGIGFTMSIFMATLAFSDPNLLAAAKLGVLLASLTAAILGLAWGARCARQKPGNIADRTPVSPPLPARPQNVASWREGRLTRRAIPTRRSSFDVDWRCPSNFGSPDKTTYFVTFAIALVPWFIAIWILIKLSLLFLP